MKLRTVKNVEILHAGVEYSLSTGPATFTPEDLRDACTAANEDPSIPSPRLKLGHVDPRFNDQSIYDASPAFGKATNLRLSENGMAIMADYVGVPDWLAEIMPTAFPSRSIEGYWGVESQMGKKWRFVLSACSLLGVTWPGVTVLEDLPLYYGEEVPPGVVIDQDAIAASQLPGGDPVKSPFTKDGATASANLDDVRRTFYNDYLPENPDYLWWWIQAVRTDPNELVVEDDESGQLYLLSFTSDTDGNVSFGEPEAVRIDYLPDNRESRKAAAAHVAAALAVGRKVLASWNTREDSVLPATASGGAMDPKQIRERLGLPEDASDEQVQEAIRELNEAAGVTPGAADESKVVPGTTVTPAGTGVATPEAPVTPEGATAKDDPDNVARAAVKLPEGMVLIDSATLDTLKVGASAGLEIKSRTEKQEREQLVSAAIADGRIAPAGRSHWLNSLEKDPTAAATLESLAKGLVPVQMRELGRGGNGAEGEAAAASGDLDLDTVQNWTDNLFPEVRGLRAQDRALAAGENPGRQRITADASYRR